MQEKDLLQKAMQQKNMMVLYRDELVAPEYAGVPVAVENELVVLQRQTNFVLDGYCALRTGDIDADEIGPPFWPANAFRAGGDARIGREQIDHLLAINVSAIE